MQVPEIPRRTLLERKKHVSCFVVRCVLALNCMDIVLSIAVKHPTAALHWLLSVPTHK